MPLLSTSGETNSPEIPCGEILQASVLNAEVAVLKGRSWTQLLDGKCLFRRALLKRFQRLEHGQLTIVDRSGTFTFGSESTTNLSATVDVRNRRFYRELVLRGAMGAAESYLRGDWDSADLVTAMRILSRNSRVLSTFDNRWAKLRKPFHTAWNMFNKNSRTRSKQNIAAHYDLNNEFFALMLDPTMTYSCGIFPSPDATLEEASQEKYDRICRSLELSSNDHVLEIGTGWGGFAIHAAQSYGCKVTTTTISEQQYVYAKNQIKALGLGNQVTLLKSDYRDLAGEFDKLVSIEMIEAVGEQYLPTFFAKCCQLLKPEGQMALQTITIPDHRYDAYRSSIDFIQKYIFPGGFLPCFSAIGDCVRQKTDFRITQIDDFGAHYAETLSRWREQYAQQLNQVKALGFDDRFVRTWHYYLCYCEAGFLEGLIGVSQVCFARAACRPGKL